MEDEFEMCAVCDCMLEIESCWECLGAGGWHECGEDTCCCLHPEINELCQTCEGSGRYLVCPNVMNHSREAKK